MSLLFLSLRDFFFDMFGQLRVISIKKKGIENKLSPQPR